MWACRLPGLQTLLVGPSGCTPLTRPGPPCPSWSFSRKPPTLSGTSRTTSASTSTTNISGTTRRRLLSQRSWNLVWCCIRDGKERLMWCLSGHRGEHQAANTKHDNDNIHLQQVDHHTAISKEQPKTLKQVIWFFWWFYVILSALRCLKRNCWSQARKWTKCTKSFWQKRSWGWRKSTSKSPNRRNKFHEFNFS